MPNSYPNFSVEAVTEGLQYAREELGFTLDRDTLRRLADNTSERWSKKGRKPGVQFQIAKREALNSLWELNRADKSRRDAYSSTVGHMFGRRSALSTASKEAARKRRAVAEPVPHPGFDPTMIGFDPKTNQGVFLFGSERH